MSLKRRSVAVVVTAAVLAILGSACDPGAKPTPSPTPTATPSRSSTAAPGGPKPPADGAYVGASVQPTKYTPDGRIQAFDTFEQDTGRKLDVVHTYHPFDQEFPDAVEKHFAAQGQQLLIGWAGSDSPGIASGKYDALIRQRAEDVKAFGKPIFLAFRWEMERPNLRSQVRSPADYIKAWKHTRAIFKEVGATNVAWVWAPLAKGFASGDAQQFYPGDDQVDWIAVDAYTGPQLRPFSAVMKPFMDFAAKHPGKPLMIAEFAIADRDGARPGWLAAARAWIKQQDRIKAVVYFNGNNPKLGARAQLGISNSTSGRKAFNAWLADPYFNTSDHSVTKPR